MIRVAFRSAGVSLLATSRRGGLRRLLAAIVLSAALAALSAVALSAEPMRALRALFLAPFSSATSLLSMVELASPLALCAVGVLISFRAGHYSLGGEGQVYAGSLAAAMTALAFRSVAGPLGTALAFVAGGAGGALIALPPAMGKRFVGADVLLSSMLVSQGSIFAIDWAIGGPLRDTSSNLVALPQLPRETVLVRLFPPAAMTVLPFIALLACLAAWFFLGRTRRGVMLDLYGANPTFAELKGYPVRSFGWTPIVVSGVLHGMAGAALALGANGTAVRGMSGGIGWNAIGVALIAGERPLSVPFAALLFSWLDSGARQAAVLSDLPPDSAQVIKAVALIVVSARPAAAAIRSSMAKRKDAPVADEGARP